MNLYERWYDGQLDQFPISTIEILGRNFLLNSIKLGVFRAAAETMGVAVANVDQSFGELITHRNEFFKTGRLAKQLLLSRRCETPEDAWRQAIEEVSAEQ